MCSSQGRYMMIDMYVCMVHSLFSVLSNIKSPQFRDNDSDNCTILTLKSGLMERTRLWKEAWPQTSAMLPVLSMNCVGLGKIVQCPYL